MWRAAKWIGGILLGLVAPVVLLLLLANTPPGRQAIAWLLPRVTGDAVRVVGLSGRLPDAIRAARVELRDAHGAYVTAQDLALDWSPLQLLYHRIAIDRLNVAQLDVLRMPVSSSEGSGVAMPIELRELRIVRLDIGADLLGTPATLAVEGSGQLASPADFSGTFKISQPNGLGSYVVSGAADATKLRATLAGEEPAGGLLGELAGVPNLGAVTLDASLAGPRNAVGTQFSITAGGLRASAHGSLDLDRGAADLTVSGDAPATQLRQGVGWQAVSVDAHVSGAFDRPKIAAHLQIDALMAEHTTFGRIAATVSGDAGRVTLNGEMAGLRLPGPNADLLAAAPLLVAADARLDAPDRPVHLTLRHPLFTAEADALTAGEHTVDASVKLPDLASFATATQVPVEGALALNLHAAMHADTTTLTANGTVGITGGQAQARALVGDQGSFNLAAVVQGSNLTISSLQFAGHDASVQASGRMAANRLDFTWSIRVGDLAAVEPGLSGQLQAQGSITGPTDDINLTADINGSVAAQGMRSGELTARVEASGLPSRPSGRIALHGDLLDASADLALTLQQTDKELAVDIQQANWKSLAARGALQLPLATMAPTGELNLTVTRLADFAPLIGRPVAGSISATISAPSGTAAPAIDARINAEGLDLAGLRGALHASANGTVQALDVRLEAAMPDLHGAPMRLTAAASVDAPARSVLLGSLSAEWKQQTLRLLAPARFGFGDGITIDRFRLGLRQAVLDVSGRAGSSLDLTASLRNLSADLVGADGSLRADARITGTMAQPTGRVGVEATGLRLRSGPGRAMPPASVTAEVVLSGVEARVDGRVTAGNSRISLTGNLPLNAAGRMNLRAKGSLDLALVAPVLAAGGTEVRGRASLDVTMTGSPAAPAVTGTARLTGGEVQDFSTGLHLTDIVALVEGGGETLRIARLSARAGQGSISATGTIGILATGVPMDLTLEAHDARPLASDLMTAVADARLTLRGEVAGQLAVGGTVRVRRAEIRIPERMPASIAVLPVRRPGEQPSAAAPAASVIALNILLEAPNQVFVRGRGVDVEFGGRMRLGGTVNAPSTQGGLDLQRGSISLAGRSLDFTRGQISFNGGSITDPALHLVATSTSGNVTATLTIGGTAQNPKITLTSVPELPQDEVLARLLFNSDTGRLGPLELASIAASLATLTGTGGIGDPLDKVRQGLGLDRLSVRTGANGSPAVEAGRYITPRVYVGARESASGATQVTVQFSITRRLKLEATAGTGGGSATGASSESTGSGVGLTYQFEY